MKTKEEIKERIALLESKCKEYGAPYFPYHMTDWNRAQFSTAIWYLSWVLESEGEIDSI